MLEGAVAHHSGPPVLSQQPLSAASIPSFLQFAPIVVCILCIIGFLCILSLHSTVGMGLAPIRCPSRKLWAGWAQGPSLLNIIRPL
jgi:hypothetical protein